ncbi:uncharacterized protein ASCRUDRAFT_80530 [Ascoidea rubescens DSM 1968]|uniref:Uncharacterized protein n=1 Tax=Ascoidea rubescens DSM 1968 TaxID=1344418 RepID=A0A1D2VIJ3_9ASCO|nr:hypothetical protein ASCRUDRAFT_80530 [Ascoidea rubescens DSM 1968]ODV61445.1 hypothetical protein ASCRUDRAFT_80530 [Ascoidea rubescens DSM 1968]
MEINPPRSVLKAYQAVGGTMMDATATICSQSPDGLLVGCFCCISWWFIAGGRLAFGFMVFVLASKAFDEQLTLILSCPGSGHK